MASLNRSNELIGKINLSELPAIINGQVAKINELGKKIEDVMSKASSAKAAAEKARGKSAGFGHKREAIEELQLSGVASAEAIGDTVDALKESFEYEKQLGEISKFLIALAAYSAEHTAQMIAQLKAAVLNKQAGVSLNDEAKERLVQVIRQLEVQGETIKRQEELEQEIAVQQALLEEKDAQDGQQDIQIAKHAERISAHSKTLNAHQQQNSRQDRDIQTLQQQDEQQDVLIAQNAKDISSANQRLEAQQQKDAEHDAQIAALVQEDDQQNVLIAQNTTRIVEQQNALEAQQQKHAEHDRKFSTLDVDNQKRNMLIEQNIQDIKGIKLSIVQVETQQSDNYEQLQNALHNLENSTNTTIGSVRLDTSNDIQKVSEQLTTEVTALTERIEDNAKSTASALDELRSRIDALEFRANKKAWKIVVTVLSGSALVLSLLQVFGIL